MEDDVGKLNTNYKEINMSELNIKLEVKDVLVVFKGKSKFNDGTYLSIGVQKNYRNNQGIAEALIALGVKEVDVTEKKVEIVDK